MIRNNPIISRRNFLRTTAGAALVSVTGCLNGDEDSDSPDDGTGPVDGQGPLQRVAVEGTTLVVELSPDADVDQVNLIQPNGELFGTRDVAAGAQQVSFEIGTAYEPGEYRVVALKGEEAVTESTTDIVPEIQIQDVGLYRNNPDKPWDEVYGESPTDAKKNGEAFVTVQNTGSGPDEVVEMRFTGDVPNPVADPRGSGIYEKESVIVSAGETAEIFSDSFPFGSEIGDEGMGCSTDGNSGRFSIILETRVTGQQATKAYNVEYTGADEMQNCEITISGA
ncbi:hypothetical protein [Halorubrum sp. Atlit-26R]|uniref:hypothetical protein n=1 Tax=Halorubrum sp. Atlit-26R TaxID=2282128 RepID=UPI000EF209EB|nr:hypothetical protein [Halorubrum sp. Atlit-26R]RLM62468.1 hypothetical protein DVK07_18980 [Halorubrum sp. Atlit-26R]